MRNIFWVFRSFGFKAGITFIWDAMKRWAQRRPKRRSPRFEELTDYEAQCVAWSFGIFRWSDREDLNRQWNAFKQDTLH